MKLQGFSVIFTLVCIPLLLVLSYYISLQVDTITLQNEYDSKLLSATYDAVSAFELNTANEDLSSVSDSLRTIIEASNNIFFNTLATNMGLSNASKAYIEPYIPSVLYTLYDGYYIFAPTTIPVVKTDEDGVALTVGQDYVKYSDAEGYTYIPENTDNPEERDEEWKGAINGVGDLIDKENMGEYGQLLYVPEDEGASGLTTNIDNAKKQIKNVLKSYMPYSARYRAIEREKGEADAYPTNWSNLTYDFNIIYTLDNYLTVEGYVQNASNPDSQIYYTESGYLIKDSDTAGEAQTIVTIVKPDGSPVSIGTYNQNQLQEIIENNSAVVQIEIKNEGGTEDVTLSTAGLEQIETIIDEYANDYYILLEDEDGFGEGDGPKNRLEFLTLNSDRWDEKSLKEKYEILLTILKNRYTEIEEQPDQYDVGHNRLGELNGLNKMINRTQYNLDLMSAIVYYAKAKVFTSWVKSHLSMIQAQDIIEISGMDFGTVQEGLRFGTREYNESGEDDSDFQTQINFKGDKTFLFSKESFEAQKEGSNLYNDSATEIGKDSNFNNHKLKVIRASIQYSLNLAMTTYNSNESYGILAQGEIRRGDNTKVNGYAMPVLQYDEWEKITENPSIVAFMQGMKCGLKVYNNYAVVSSTNNELAVSPENMYYVAYDNANEYESFNGGYINDTDYYYHKIDCKYLLDDITDENTKIVGFSSKEAKYDKIYDKMAARAKYKYDHRNMACYTCVNDGNYSDKKVNIFGDDSDPGVSAKKKSLRKAFYLGLGKERNNVYKMNAFRDSFGFQRLYNNMAGYAAFSQSDFELNQLRALKITFGGVYTNNGEQSVTFKAGLGLGDGVITNLFSNNDYSIPANAIQVYPITIDCSALNIDSDVAATYDGLDIYNLIQFETSPEGLSSALKNTIKNIEAIYK